MSLTPSKCSEDLLPLLKITPQLLTKFTSEPIFCFNEFGYSIYCTQRQELMYVWGTDDEIQSFQEIRIPDIFNLKSVKEGKPLPQFLLPVFNSKLYLKLRDKVQPLARQLAEDINMVTFLARKWQEEVDPERNFTVPWKLVHYDFIQEIVENDEIVSVKLNWLFPFMGNNVIMSFYHSTGKMYLCRVQYDYSKPSFAPPTYGGTFRKLLPY